MDNLEVSQSVAEKSHIVTPAFLVPDILVRLDQLYLEGESPTTPPHNSIKDSLQKFIFFRGKRMGVLFDSDPEYELLEVPKSIKTHLGDTHTGVITAAIKLFYLGKEDNYLTSAEVLEHSEAISNYIFSSENICIRRLIELSGIEQQQFSAYISANGSALEGDNTAEPAASENDKLFKFTKLTEKLVEISLLSAAPTIIPRSANVVDERLLNSWFAILNIDAVETVDYYKEWAAEIASTKKRIDIDLVKKYVEPRANMLLGLENKRLKYDKQYMANMAWIEVFLSDSLESALKNTGEMEERDWADYWRSIHTIAKAGYGGVSGGGDTLRGDYEDEYAYGVDSSNISRFRTLTTFLGDKINYNIVARFVKNLGVPTSSIAEPGTKRRLDGDSHRIAFECDSDYVLEFPVQEEQAIVDTLFRVKKLTKNYLDSENPAGQDLGSLADMLHELYSLHLFNTINSSIFIAYINHLLEISNHPQITHSIGANGTEVRLDFLAYYLDKDSFRVAFTEFYAKAAITNIQ